MIAKIDFEKNFIGLTVPDELDQLLDFQNYISKDDFFSAGFELMVDEDKYGLKTYSENEKFLNSILEFASADGTGSTYGFWRCDNTINLNATPIVVLGGEGGIHVVAENIKGLLEILTFDAEPIVDWDKVDYFKSDEDYEPSAKIEEYKRWLYDSFKIEPTDNADRVVKLAHQKYENEFQRWLKTYYAK